ncbi:MAG TPA: hypothetical protein PKI14_17305 [Fervidobacterium sp.]|nr:hypothetical protein [Fervidobacterium sp.]HUM44705.1 hypothetical protein [Fervidobacterium sp.]
MAFDLARESFDKLHHWIINNGYYGWDPYDVKGTELYSKYFYSEKTRHFLVRRGLDVVSELFPFAMRRVMNLEQQINAKALGLLLYAYGNMFEITREESYLEESSQIVDWLVENTCQEFAGYSWGYPFDWNSRVFIPKNTPSAIASVTVGEGFLRLYEITGNDWYLEVCNKICEFLTQELNIHQKGEESICFSYTPIDDFQVHNINLLVANYLIRIGLLINKERYVNLGVQAANFSVSEQNEDGSIYYWSREQTNARGHLDVYHSGFEIRALYGISKNTGIERFEDSYKKYLCFFLNNYFSPSHIKRTPERAYPIDIHGCAEAINCLATVYNENRNVEQSLRFAVEYTINKMQTQEGWFIYRIHKFPVKVKIPYLRWGQAWMMKALSQYLILDIN